jgi:hypothetical protein
VIDAIDWLLKVAEFWIREEFELTALDFTISAVESD